MRLLEEHNPDISFDWSRLAKSASSSGAAGSGAPPDAAGSDARDERRRDRRDRRSRQAEGARPGIPNPAEPVHRPVPELPQAIESEEAPPEDASLAFAEPEPEPEPRTLNLENPRNPEPEEPEEPEEPGEPDLGPTAAVPEPLEERYARLGAEGLARLRSRYREIRARIESKPLEEGERAELFGRVERLNPDAWHSEGEVAHALEEYEAVFESLRPLVGRQPRSRRL